MNRFVVDRADLASDRLPLPAAIRHQVLRVLRLRDGDEVTLLDGLGGLAVCRLAERGTALEILERRAAGNEPTHRLIVCQALLKGDGLERVVQQGTELGVARFRLVVTDRCVARDLSARRLERLRTIARESTEQSERGIVPQVDAAVPLREVATAGSVLLYERGQGEAPRLSALEPPETIVVGPEGGFTPDEIADAVSRGARLASLGPRILRAESVAIAAAAIVLSRAGDFA